MAGIRDLFHLRKLPHQSRRSHSVTVTTPSFAPNPKRMAGALAVRYGTELSARGQTTAHAKNGARFGIQSAARDSITPAVAYVVRPALRVCEILEFPAPSLAMGAQPGRRSMPARMATKRTCGAARTIPASAQSRRRCNWKRFRPPDHRTAF